MYIFYILIPVLEILSTKVLCANKYKIIKGTIIINVPVDKIQLEYASETVVLIPITLWIYAPKLSTSLASEVLTKGLVPKNILE